MATYLTEQQINAKLVTLVQKVDTNFAKKKDAITNIELLDLVAPLPSGVTDEGKYIVVTYVDHVDGSNEHKEYIKLEVDSEGGTDEGLTTEQAQQLTTAYEHSQTPHVSADDIPTKTSDLTNDSGFITSSDLPTVPTKVSDLANDKNYITSIPSEYVTETELKAKGYLTSHQDISDLQTKTDDSLTTTDKTVIGAINEVKLSIPTRTSELENNSNFITNDDLPTVPTKVSDLENDSNFVTNSKMLEAIANAQLGNGEDSDIDLSVYQPIEESTLTTTAKTIPTAINELKSGLDDKVNKTDITKTIDGSSTDTQIPSAKATYDLANTKANTNHTHNTSDIKGLSIPTPTTIINSSSTDTEFASTKAVYDSAIKEKNIKTFTVLAQLGLEDGCSVKDIFLAAPVSSLTTINVTSDNIKNVPSSNGVLIILKRGTRFSIEFKVSVSGSVCPNELYIGQLKGSDGSGLVWNKVITDTDIANLSIPSKTSELENDSNYLSTEDIIDNLTSTDTNKLLSANQGKILNDTKLNKTDANKLNCVVIDTGSLKEYILTNFTGAEEKTYHFIANPTCTDLPKASNFYITVETPGLYTYKVTAKELNDSNGIYVCTYRTTSSSWSAWEKVCTTTVADVPKTLITISDETNYKNSATCESFYIVKNGTCFVTLTLDCVSPSNDIAIGNLPSAYGVFRFSMACVDGVMNGYILPSGALKVSGGTANTEYYVISFSYPVAES